MKHPISFFAECPLCHRKVRARTSTVLELMAKEHLSKCPARLQAKRAQEQARQPQQDSLFSQPAAPKEK